MPPLSPDKLLDPGFLFNPNPGVPPEWYAYLAVACGVLLVLAEGLYFFWAKPTFARDPYRRKLAKNVALAVGWISAIAILLIAASYLTIPVLSMRFLLLLDGLVALGLIVYAIYYTVKVYPIKVALAEREAIRQRYLPQQRPRQLSATARRRKKGKR